MELSELAEEYYAEAQRLKKKIEELEAATDISNPAAYNRTVAGYQDMYLDTLFAYNQMKKYTDDDRGSN